MMILAPVCILCGVIYLVGTVFGLVLGFGYFLLGEFLPVISRIGWHAAEQRLLHRAMK
jgi:hypothetical protein